MSALGDVFGNPYASVDATRVEQDALCFAAGVKVPADANAVTREAFTLAARWRLLANRMAQQ